MVGNYGMRRLLAMTFMLVLSLQAAFAGERSGPMTDARLKQLIEGIGGNLEGHAGFWQFTFDQREVMVISDEKKDRMRILVRAASTDQLGEDRMMQLLKANFSNAMDARYAVARNTVWSMFVHPLSSLNDREFMNGLGQVINLAKSYGGGYTAVGKNPLRSHAVKREQVVSSDDRF